MCTMEKVLETRVPLENNQVYILKAVIQDFLTQKTKNQVFAVKYYLLKKTITYDLIFLTIV